MKISEKKAIAILIASLFFGLYSCDTSIIPEGNDAEFTHFEFVYMQNSPIIDRANNTIYAEIDSVVDVSSLITSFVLTHGATAYIESTVQQSGISENDFTRIVEYKIVSENKSTVNNWRVTISKISVPQQNNTDFTFASNTSIPAGTYYMNGTITIADNVYFVLQPGVKIILGPDAKFSVGNKACFIAKGTAEQPIIFTSETSKWDGFVFNNTDEVEFQYCKFDNAGKQNLQFIKVNNSNIGISYSEFTNIGCTCFLLDNNSAFRVFDNNILTDVAHNDNAYPIVFNSINSASNIGENNIISSKGILITNGMITNNITLIGQTCPYVLEDDIRCTNVDVTFFIRSGVTILMNEGKEIFLGNSRMVFKAEGTETKPIIFKGNSAETVAGFWKGFSINGYILPGSNFTHCQVYDAGNGSNTGAIKCDRTDLSRLTIQNCMIKNTKSHGIYFTKNSNAKLNGNNNIIVASPYQEIFYEE